MIRAGLRRLVIAVALAVGVAGVCSLAIGLLMGAAIQRSLSVGYMLAGSFMMVIGLTVGLRGFGRPSSEAHSGDERIASSAILLGIGCALVVLGIGLDPRSDIV